MPKNEHGMRSALEMPQSAIVLHGIAARVVRRIPALADKFVNAGDVASFVRWQSASFDETVKLFWKREELWQQMSSHLDPTRPLFVLEFGVAWGYATEHWLTMLKRADVEWHGFDRFTGLPRGWRGLPEGEFDAGGRTPEIDDARVTWHVGDVEDTLGDVDLTAEVDAQWLVLFDLDIYEPTAEAWRVLSPMLKRGDLLYFDEAIDADERRVLNEMVLPSGRYSPIGATSLALGLKVTEPPSGA